MCLWCRTHDPSDPPCLAHSLAVLFAGIFPVQDLDCVAHFAGNRVLSLFILTRKTRSTSASGPKFYDSLDPDDRSLFLIIKRGIPPAEMKELQKDAMEQGRDIDVLIFLRVFAGPERQRKYAHLL